MFADHRQDADYQLKVVVTDMDGYQALLLERITRIPASPACIRASCWRRVIDKTALPLPGAWRRVLLNWIYVTL